ncbi:MAG: hypothetical protein ACI92E_000055, partial [Oceanicoccus sp.]
FLAFHNPNTLEKVSGLSPLKQKLYELTEQDSL